MPTAATTRPAAFDAAHWTRRVLAEEPPRAASLVITVFGDAIAPHGGAVWLGGLIELMAAFGVSERLVRTSVFRLGEEGWLESRRSGRRSLYALTGDGVRRLEHAYRRIYAPPAAEWDGSWTILLAPRAAGDAGARAELRRALEWEGFAAVAPGVLAHPRADRAALDDLLRTMGVADETVVFAARDDGVPGGRPARALVEQFWRLDALAADYRGFADRFAPVASALGHGAAVEPRDAFVVRTLLIHAFRRLILHDPRLPVEMLPRDWPGRRAFAICRTLYARLVPASERYLQATLAGADGPLPAVGAGFAGRFGGAPAPGEE